MDVLMNVSINQQLQIRLAQWDEKSNDIKVDKRCRIEVFRISEPERR